MIASVTLPDGIFVLLVFAMICFALAGWIGMRNEK